MDNVTTDQDLCIFVLGMHRSGTSAMTRVLNLVGAELASHLWGAAEHNESGHWEPAHVVAANDQLLAESGSHWCDWRPLRIVDGALVHDFGERIATIFGEEFGRGKPIVVKDPRISRMVDLYLPIVHDLGYTDRHVLMVRNPSDVAASLAARDGATGPYAGLLWLRYQLDAERATRGRPRVIVPFESLMSDWRPEVERILSTLQADFSVSQDVEESIDAFLNPDQVHHVTDAIEPTDQVSTWLSRAHAAFLNLATDADTNDADSLAALDQVSAELDAVPTWIADVLFEQAVALLDERFTLTQQVKETANRLERAAAEGRHLNEQLKASRATTKKLRAKIAAMKASMSWRITKPLRATKGPKKS